MLRFFHSVTFKIQTLMPGFGRKIHSAKDHILNVSESIETVISDVEGDFLNLGQKLQAIYSDTNNLTNQTKRTAGIASENKDGMSLSGISKFAQDLVQRLHLYQNEISDSLKSMNSAQLQLARLSELCTNNEKLVTLLDVIALNIAIECNRSEKAKGMFVAFVEEVKQLSVKTAEVSQKLIKDTDTARISQVKSQKEIANKLNELSSLSKSAESIVEKTTGRIDVFIKNSLISIEDAGRYSGEISKQVGKIVIAIQFHDIIRQKIEHIVSSLKEAVELCKGRKTGRKSVKKIYSTLLLQNAQIELIISEIDNAYNEIKSGFNEIEEKVERLLNSLSESNIGNESEDSFSMVVENLKSLDKLILEALVLNNHMGGIASKASTSANELKQYVDLVQNISLDLHRKALNAIIKSAHLGKSGQTLEIFAQEVTRTSSTSNAFADNVVNIINTITELSDSLEKDSNINEEDENSKLENGIKNITESYNDFTESSATATDLSNDVRKNIDLAITALTFMPEFSYKIKETLMLSETICKTLIHFKGVDDDIRDVIESSDRYTMESERLIHSELIGENTETDKNLIEEKKDNDQNIKIKEDQLSLGIYESEGIEEDNESLKEKEETKEDDDLGDFELF